MNEANNNNWTIVHRTKNNDYIRKIELISLAKQLKIDVEKQFMRNNKKLKKTELLQHIRNIYVNNIYKNILNMTDIDFNLSKFNVKNNPQKSSGNILSNNNSGCQERVKDNLIRNNKNLKKWQHNSKWIISKLNNHNLNHKLCQTGVCNNKINIEYGQRRAGDAVSLVSDTKKLVETIKWKPVYDDLEAILRSSINWEKKLQNEKVL